MKLTDRFDVDAIEYKGRSIRLRLFFDVVLRALELAKDQTFSKLERIDIWVSMFIERAEDLSGLDMQDKAILVITVFNRFIAEEGSGKQTGEPMFDFEQDAGYIYASFLQDYNIDLYEHQGRMHWRKFKALLNGLSDDTKFKQVVSIRAAKLPKPNKHNAEQIKQLREMKRVYALKSDDKDEAKRLSDKFSAMADVWAKRGDGQQ